MTSESTGTEVGSEVVSKDKGSNGFRLGKLQMVVPMTRIKSS